MSDITENILKIDHIGLAVKNIEKIRKIWKEVFDLEGETHEYPEVNMKGLIIWVGDTHFKFTESLVKDERWTGYIEKHGEGINHVAFQVKDLTKIMKDLMAKGIKFRHEKPMQFADGICNFIDIEDLCVTVELAELRPNWKEIRFKAYEDKE